MTTTILEPPSLSGISTLSSQDLNDIIDKNNITDSPFYLINEEKLEKNLQLLDYIQEKTGCKILLALKAYSTFSTFPLIKKYLTGTTASSVHEALLGKEEFGKEVHTYAPAFKNEEIETLCEISDCITFNSHKQWQTHKQKVQSAKKSIKSGLRLNPEHIEVEKAIYNPCAPFSRLGIVESELNTNDLEGISGYLIHTLCGQDSYALERTLKTVEEKFGHLLEKANWLNLGGGHLLTSPNYDIEHLCNLLITLQNKYQLQIYLEPGEAVVSNCGYFVTTVLDIVQNGMPLAIIDSSAVAHMPDIIEMPYRPEIMGSGKANDKSYTYRVGGVTCLSGDIVSDYSFDQPLNIGDHLIFSDMAQYTMVKNTTFNGIPLPSIATLNKDKIITIQKSFNYQDFKSRLS